MLARPTLKKPSDQDGDGPLKGQGRPTEERFLFRVRCAGPRTVSRRVAFRGFRLMHALRFGADLLVAPHHGPINKIFRHRVDAIL
jgi:hypothetical protein